MLLKEFLDCEAQRTAILKVDRSIWDYELQ